MGWDADPCLYWGDACCFRSMGLGSEWCPPGCRVAHQNQAWLPGCSVSLLARQWVKGALSNASISAGEGGCCGKQHGAAGTHWLLGDIRADSCL